jgi:circadian clock protein KaiB
MRRHPLFKFRLYIAGAAQNSALAVANINALCAAYLPGRYDIEVIDVFQDPKRALAEGIFMTPLLIKLSPAPTCRIVGTLKQTETVLAALGLDPSVLAAVA